MNSKFKVYDDNQKIKDALQVYFSKYHFADGGYNLKWFKIKLGPFYFPFPNTKSRVAAVKLHDIHHLLTGYTALFKGETEIGAWEIASGCGPYKIAWFLNFGSFLYGVFLYPRSLYKAFMRGRRATTNLYYGAVYDETLLDTSIIDLKKKLGIDSKINNTFGDRLLFSFYVLVVTGIPIVICIILVLFLI
jgi:hypothetical protein